MFVIIRQQKKFMPTEPTKEHQQCQAMKSPQSPSIQKYDRPLTLTAHMQDHSKLHACPQNSASISAECSIRHITTAQLLATRKMERNRDNMATTPQHAASSGAAGPHTGDTKSFHVPPAGNSILCSMRTYPPRCHRAVCMCQLTVHCPNWRCSAAAAEHSDTTVAQRPRRGRSRRAVSRLVDRCRRMIRPFA